MPDINWSNYTTQHNFFQIVQICKCLWSVICHIGLISNFEIREIFWYWVIAEVSTRKASYFSSRLVNRGPQEGLLKIYTKFHKIFTFLLFFVIVVYSAASLQLQVFKSGSKRVLRGYFTQVYTQIVDEAANLIEQRYQVEVFAEVWLANQNQIIHKTITKECRPQCSHSNYESYLNLDTFVNQSCCIDSLVEVA